jgi:hypothetical protein
MIYRGCDNVVSLVVFSVVYHLLIASSTSFNELLLLFNIMETNKLEGNKCDYVVGICINTAFMCIKVSTHTDCTPVLWKKIGYF